MLVGLLLLGGLQPVTGVPLTQRDQHARELHVHRGLGSGAGRRTGRPVRSGLRLPVVGSRALMMMLRRRVVFMTRVMRTDDVEGVGRKGGEEHQQRNAAERPAEPSPRPPLRPRPDSHTEESVKARG